MTDEQTLIITIPELDGGNATYTIDFESDVAHGSTVHTFVEASTSTFTSQIGIGGSPTSAQVASLIEEAFDNIPGYVGSVSSTVVTLTSDNTGTAYDFTVTGTAISGGTITASATAGVNAVSGITAGAVFTMEVLGDGPSFNSTSSIGTDQILTPLTSSAGNDHYSSGSYGGRNHNFRWEVSQRNLKKGTFTLLLRQGDDNHKSKQIIETFTDLSLDPESTNYILKRIGDAHQIVKAEDGVAYLEDSGSFPNKSKNVRIKQLHKKTPNYLNPSTGEVDMEQYSDSGSFLPVVGSGSYAGAFGEVEGGSSGQIAGDYGAENNVHPFNFYLEADPAVNTQGIRLSADGLGAGSNQSDTQVAGASVGGGYMTALSLLKNKDQYDFNLSLIHI